MMDQCGVGEVVIKRLEEVLGVEKKRIIEMVKQVQPAKNNELI